MISFFSPEDQEKWGRWLDDFRRDLYPAFEERGFTFQEAVNVIMMNKLFNQLLDMEDVLIMPDDGDEWKLE